MMRTQTGHYEAFKNTLTAMDKWMHLAIYLGYIAEEHGADKAEIDRLIRLAPKAEIDALLLTKMKERGNEESTHLPQTL